MFECVALDITNNKQQMIDYLLMATTITAEKYNVDKQQTMKNILMRLIRYNSYDGATKKNDCRTLVSSFSRDAYFCLIINEMLGTMASRFRSKDGETYRIDDLLVEKMVDTFCSRVLSKNKSFNKPQSSNNEPIKPQNVKYYSPSQELKKSIIQGTQTDAKKTSYSFNEMMAYSDRGKKRGNQEDSYYIGVHPGNPNFKIMVVADGMGGQANGEIASNIAVREMMSWFESLPVSEFYLDNNYGLHDAIEQKIQEIHKKICSKTNGGTTLCFSIIKNNSIIMGNVGDSQGYIINNNELIYATSPDSLPIAMGVPKDIARYHNMNNVVNNCLGAGMDDDVVPSVQLNEVKLENQNTYKIVLCSDGVTDCISERKIIDIINNNQNAAQALVEYAIENDSYLYFDLKNLSNRDRLIIESQNYLRELKEHIAAGKDNTTAVEAVVRR